jgi:hypothetical protein
VAWNSLPTSFIARSPFNTHALPSIRTPACSHEFKAAAPLLIIVPAALIDFWEGEWQFWAPDDQQQLSSTAEGTTPAPQPPQGGGAAGGSGGQPTSTAAATTGVNLVVYRGNSSARGVLLDHELWLNPSSMDVKMNVRYTCMGF